MFKFHGESNDQTAKDIPVISDIERIKKVVEILEFVGEKVGAIIESLPTPQAQTSEKKVTTQVTTSDTEEPSTETTSKL